MTVPLTRNDLFPGPWDVVPGIVELLRKGLLLKYIVASLFRATWGFFLELGRMRLFRRVILPATLPQILTGIRIALGIAWLVVVAAEMIAVNSGLGYLIIDARNAGKRYDLVVAGMVVIGLIGPALDLLVRRLERFEEVSWGYGNQ